MPNQPSGCLGFFSRLFSGGGSAAPAGPDRPRVQVNKYFVTNAEADFFRVLRNIVGDRGHILSQVSLRQLLWFPGNNQSNSGRQGWQNKVAQKSIDFLICDPATLRPRLAIELDEPSHARADRQTRDEEVELMLRSAGLPLIRVLTSRTYNTRELEAVIRPYLSEGR